MIVLGGDGAINEAANGLAGSATPLAVLPGGTANCLAMETGLGARIETAAARLSQCVSRSIAIGRLSFPTGVARHFLLMCGAGLDARIVHDVHADFKQGGGKLAFWISGFSQFTHRVEPLEVRVNGVTYTCGFMLASRVRNYGGDLEIAGGASLLRDDFEMVVFEGSNPLRYAWYMVGVATGRVRRMRGVRALHARSAEILTAAHVQIDGEYVGRGPVTIAIVPAGIHLLLPPPYG